MDIKADKRSPSPVPASITRRTFLTRSTGAAAGAACLPALIGYAEDEKPGAHQATGTRVGEITDRTAIVWTRLTAASARNNAGHVIPGRAQDYRAKDLPEVTVPPEQLEGACAGAPGRVRVRYGTGAELKAAATTDWAVVNEKADFIHQFGLRDLQPGTRYFYTSETSDAEGRAHADFRGEFQTAPSAATPTDLLFCVMTCQGYPDRGHPEGHAIYPAMLGLNPAFTCLTGDLVYYDNDMPRATSPALARYHWQRMFSLPRLIEFNRRVGTYWLKDDHDTLNNDSWPGAKMGAFTFAEGQAIFRQQAPMANGPSYRTFRWGRDLQVWLADGRDFRSPNRMPDGPGKTIWGEEQKAWFKRTVKESAATWKVLVSPTPLVGPDRGGKNDNHANKSFQHEGDDLRAWFKEHVPDNFFVICGDRHWQYHSVHPETGLHEFSVGAASDEHAGGSPGNDPKYHRFHRVKGGFLSIKVTPGTEASTILFQHRSVTGAVVDEWSAKRATKA
jgi:alkaline phosphatase D